MIRHLFGVGGLTLAFFVLITISMGMLTGATVAYAVEDTSDATVEFNGTHFSVGGADSAEVLPQPDVPLGLDPVGAISAQRRT